MTLVSQLCLGQVYLPRGRHRIQLLRSLVLCLIPLVVLFGCPLAAKTYYVSPSGLDTNPGTFDLPFLTISRAHSAMSASGDTICVRGGVYPCSTTVTLSKSGTLSARLYLIAYPGERARLDCSAMPRYNSSARGIRVSGSYWYIRDIDVWSAGDNGMNVSGSYNIIERCTFSENGDTGLQLGGGAAYNQVLNCDSFFNADSAEGNADGFAPKLDVGTGNSFFGCRSWQNSDDGWDGYLRPADNVSTTMENCWTFRNGYLKNDSASKGNGNGFKMGGSDDKLLMHNATLKNCVAFDNRVKGFDQNNNRGSMTLLNCTAYRNGTNYGMGSFVNYAAGKIVTVKNCLVLGPLGSLNDSAVQATNSWRPPFSPATAGDFVSVDTTGMRGPRKADGSLPDLAFLHLVASSAFVDAGTDVGLPFNGSGPDLGAFETVAASAVNDGNADQPSEFEVQPNYPNPFNPSTQITVVLPHAGRLSVRIHDLMGRLVSDVLDAECTAGSHRVSWAGQTFVGPASSGTYFARVSYGDRTRVLKMLLLK